MFDPKTLPLDDQYTIVQNYLWANVQRMRNLNPYIPGAPARAVIPADRSVADLAELHG